jgi:SAM-dependent methyltransferase
VHSGLTAAEIIASCGDGPALVWRCGSGRLVSDLCALGVDARGVEPDAAPFRLAIARLGNRITAALPSRMDTPTTVVWSSEGAAITDREIDDFVHEMTQVLPVGSSLRLALTRRSEAGRWSEDVVRALEASILNAGFQRAPRYMMASPRPLNVARLDGAWIRQAPSPLQPRRPDATRSVDTKADAILESCYRAAAYVSPGDSVLLLECGPGEGVAVVGANSLCATALGLDRDAASIDYARRVYGDALRGLSFGIGSPASLTEGSRFDLVVDLDDAGTDPDKIWPLLKPGGRALLGVEEAEDDASLRLRLPEPRWIVEDVIGTLPVPGEPARRYAVVMKDPLAGDFDDAPAPVRPAVAGDPPVLAVTSHYSNPWLVGALVSRGSRVTASEALGRLARRVVQADPVSVEAQSALCVLAYQQLEIGLDAAEMGVLLSEVDACLAFSDWTELTPIQTRWGISLLYVSGLLCMKHGRLQDGLARLERCALAPFERFGALLATKTVDASYRIAMARSAEGDPDGAMRWHRRALSAAEVALHCRWSEDLGIPERLRDYVLPELTTILDLATRSATALSLSSAQRQSLRRHDRIPANMSVHGEALAAALHVARDRAARENAASRSEIMDLHEAWKHLQAGCDEHARRAELAQTALAEARERLVAQAMESHEAWKIVQAASDHHAARAEAAEKALRALETRLAAMERTAISPLDDGLDLGADPTV